MGEDERRTARVVGGAERAENRRTGDSQTDSSHCGFAEALEAFISVDNARALVTMGESVKFKEVHKSFVAKFQKRSVQRSESDASPR